MARNLGFPGASYDNWKTTNPDDAFLGPDPDEEGEEEERLIVVSHVQPPIPTKEFDYCAFYEGDEESKQYGWGETEELAIADLLARFAEGYYK
jgi:hypothetical protein